MRAQQNNVIKIISYVFSRAPAQRIGGPGPDSAHYAANACYDFRTMTACPNCKRRVITRRDMLCANLDGGAPCRICGRIARLDLTSRLMISCVLAITLLPLFLYGGIFYSGHFFLTSIFFVFGGWRILSSAGLPFLTLEAVVSGVSIDRKQSILILALLLTAAIALDGIMSSRFDSDVTL